MEAHGQLEPGGRRDERPRSRPVVAADRVAEALGLLEVGRIEEARSALVALLVGSDPAASHPGNGAFAPLAEAELEDAFREAAPDTGQMIDADGIAMEAIRAARLDDPEPEAGVDPLWAEPAGDAAVVEPVTEDEAVLARLGAPFRTRTMADLLERQGDAESADSIRRTLGSGRGASRGETIRTLERWLARLRRGDA